MAAILNFIPAPVAIVLIIVGFVALAVGAIRMGYKQLVKDLAYDLVCKAEDSIMGSGQGAKKLWAEQNPASTCWAGRRTSRWRACPSRTWLPTPKA